MNVKKRMAAFRYAWEGIIHGLQTERHMQYHALSALVVVGAGWWTGLTVTEWCLVILLIGGMFAFELMNAAVERVVDLVTDEYALLAKRAKDVAAGAVLVYAMTSAVIGCFIFLPKWFG
ncbi:diacylglycerol kinase family protein [Planococcaceae bacterium Storch 2/2-2]|nr:diacylglycerol kinase family protein [Planococcaceae bacterium Storch 2/2-2]